MISMTTFGRHLQSQCNGMVWREAELACSTLFSGRTDDQIIEFFFYISS